MPYADPQRRKEAARKSDKRQGRRSVTLSLDAATAAALDRAAVEFGGKAPALRAILKPWSSGQKH